MPATAKKPRPSGKGTRRRYNWPKARELYVEGVADPESGETVYPSLRMVGQLLNIEPARVRERSATDGWVTARASHQAELARTRQEVRLRRVAEKATDIDLRVLDAAQAGIRLVSQRIGDALRAEAIPLADRTLAQQEALIPPAELAALSLALRRLHSSGLAALGERNLVHPDEELAAAYQDLVLDSSHARLVESFAVFAEEARAAGDPAAIEVSSTPAEDVPPVG